MPNVSPNSLDKAIIDVLMYFEIFSFPLDVDEIHKYLRIKVSNEHLEEQIAKLVANGKIYQLDNCYSLNNNYGWLEKKQKGYKKAQKEIEKGKRIANFIMKFPFVRMVAISGSLSKGFAGDTSDIDFFIITDSQHLWTSRSLLHLLKKASFLVNAQHSLCMNYFIADKHLKLEEQNYFTAIELSTLIPVTGHSYYQKLIEANTWVGGYLPNFSPTFSVAKKRKIQWVKRSLECVFSSSTLNTFLFNLTDSKWRRKWKRKGVSDEDYELAFKTKLHVSKNHPDNNQKVILEELERKGKNE